MLKIVKTKMAKPNQRNEGISLTFDKPVALNGGLSTREWFIGWGKLAGIIEEHIARKK